MFGIVSRNGSRTKNVKVHALHLEAQSIGGTISKAQKGCFSIKLYRKKVSILLYRYVFRAFKSHILSQLTAK